MCISRKHNLILCFLGRRQANTSHIDSISRKDASTALKLLAEASATRQEELSKYEEDPDLSHTDEEVESDSPISDEFFSEGGQAAIAQLTNFTMVELNGVWDIIQTNVEQEWGSGRGRNSNFKPKDVLLITLTVLKYAGNWDFLGRMLKVKGPTFETMIMSFVTLVWEYLYEEAVAKWRKEYSMWPLAQEKTLFKYHRFKLYAKEVTFQQSNRPTVQPSNRKS